MNSFLLNVGLETLHLRMPKHCENARKVAEWLLAREDVAWVNYPLRRDLFWIKGRKTGGRRVHG